MNRKKIWMFIFIPALLAAIGCAVYVGGYYWNAYQEEQRMLALQQEMMTTAETIVETEPETEFTGEIEGEEAEVPEDIVVEEEEAVIPVDFEKLQAINPDIYAWIEVPDTKINYPIAQYPGEDQSYYLSHSMYRASNVAGCIYTETYNDKDFEDPNTVIYGHNMKNGSMFKGLHSFADKAYFDEHRYVYIYTPEEVRKYEIFAAYENDNRHLMVSYDFDDPEVFEKYLRYVTSRESMYVNIRSDVKLDKDDKIITMSTCVGGRPESRYMVQAVLVEDEESNEESSEQSSKQSGE